MLRLILIQNCWRLDQNALFDLPDDHLTNVVVGNIDSRCLKRIDNYTQRSPAYLQFSRKSAFEFKKKLLDIFNISCMIFNEDPLALLQDLIINNDIRELRVEEPVAYDEHHDIMRIKELFPNLKISSIWSNSLFYPAQLPDDCNMYNGTFTKFRKYIEENSVKIINENTDFEKLKNHNIISNFLDIELTTNLVEGDLLFEPGENASLSHLHNYTFITNTIDTYKQTRNQLLGVNFSSRFSFGLAHGVISPKKIWNTVEDYERQVIKNDSTYWVKFELLWREFFRHVMKYNKKAFFLKRGIKSISNDCSNDLSSLENWKTGYTDSNFVNANIIELNKTGYMSNRGRQIVASYLVNDLNLNWILGAQYFESKLLDYDVSSNWCNWAYIAGVGNDSRKRYFNIPKQQKLYDPNDKYIEYWLSKRINS